MMENQTAEIKSIIASVFFLESESRKHGLNGISAILKKALADIDLALEDKIDTRILFHDEVMKSDLYYVLTLINRYSNIDESGLNAIAKAIEFYGKNIEAAH